MIVENVERFFRFLKSAIPEKEYEQRRRSVFEYYREALRTGMVLVRSRDQRFLPLDFYDDLPMYYLFQIELYLGHYVEHDAAFIARLLPKWEVIGSQLENLQTAKNFDLEVEKLLRPRQRSVENTLFEMIAACLYIRNGYDEIEFIQETKEKRPDLRAGDLFIECKRKDKECSYAIRERRSWYKQYAPVSAFLLNEKLPIVVEVVFKDELESYPQDYLSSIVRQMLSKGEARLENERIVVSSRPSQIARYDAERARKPIRMDKPLFSMLLFGYDVKEGGMTSALGLRYDRGMYKVSPIVDFACAGIWHSTSTAAIRNKAISMKSSIEKAINQIPAYSGANIHLCYESYEGTHVEQEILRKAVNELGTLDEKYREISAMYIHVIRPHLDDVDDSVVDEYAFEIKVTQTHILPNTYLFMNEPRT